MAGPVVAPLNRAEDWSEHDWLLCRPCHREPTHGGYLARFSRLGEHRAFQGAVLTERGAPGPDPRTRPPDAGSRQQHKAPGRDGWGLCTFPRVQDQPRAMSVSAALEGGKYTCSTWSA